MDLSQIDDQLYIAARPQSADAPEVAAHGVRLILNMIPVKTPAALGSAPFRVVWLPWLDAPFLPIPIRLLRRGTRAALAAMQSGDSVLTYCRQGRHRSVAMACAILIAKGMTADQAMRHVTQQRPRADPGAAHIARVIRRFEREWPDGRPPSE
ncbi:MAG: dual specificity protein phosphatase family protein [Anaerolineales bacterium]|nr:dual specificity protein phosphatase family protein [Anaerolineales bacterium]